MTREQTINHLKTTEFDLLIVGGGITGVGVALDAQTRGLSVGLIEMGDFASGTSSKSTKLIHGGLRYLKQLEFKLVNEVGRERAVVHKIAPHLVHPDHMLLPLVKGGTYGYWLTSIGLWIYDILAGVKKSERRKMLNLKEVRKKEPLLRFDILEGGGFYSEYRTDDSRLVISIAKTASQKGATLGNYVKAVEPFYLNDRIAGFKAKDVISGEEFLIKASKVVNASGPWVDEVRSLDEAQVEKKLILSKGVHIVIPRKKLPINQTVYFDTPDGRMIFAIPRGRVCYLGTTDTLFEGDKSSLFVTREDAQYIVSGVNHMFPNAKLKLKDVESSWAGLRPLIKEESKGNMSGISRKDEIFVSNSGMISIAGGKLTGYRKMSERVVDEVVKGVDKELLGCTTDQIVISGGDFHDYSEVNQFIDTVFEEFPDVLKDRYDAEYLVHNYGKEATQILKESRHQFADSDDPLIMAEIAYTMEHEMVVSALDFFERRTGRLNFNIDSIRKNRSRILEVMNKKLRWSPNQLKKEKLSLENAMKRATSFL